MAPLTPTGWLVRIPAVFEGFSSDILSGLGAESFTRLSGEYVLLKSWDESAFKDSAASKFVHWNLPVHHSWPCKPEKIEGFIEKAAQALARKFSDASPQSVLAGQLDPGGANRYYKSLASNLRGRALQLFPPQIAERREIEEQDPELPTLFCLVGKDGLFGGLQSPQQANGFYPGGTKFVSQGAASTISRAGAKIAEALHYLRLFREPPAKGAHWLELGASPGGVTSELLARGYQVTAIDRAPLDKRLNRAAGLKFVEGDVGLFRPKADERYAAIMCDMNGDTLQALAQVIRLSRNLSDSGVAIFTLKTPGVATYLEMNSLYETVIAKARDAGLDLFAKTHLTYNRLEFTLFFQKSTPS